MSQGQDSILLYEFKIMHSQRFWHREKEGGLGLPYHELQVAPFLWLSQGKYPDAEPRLCYVSKDDMAVMTGAVPAGRSRWGR